MYRVDAYVVSQAHERLARVEFEWCHPSRDAPHVFIAASPYAVAVYAEACTTSTVPMEEGAVPNLLNHESNVIIEVAHGELPPVVDVLAAADIVELS